MRRQANLVKLAREHGVEELLPFTTKGTAERRRRRQETGLRVKGTGKGERVKGHKWERTMKARYVTCLNHIQKAMDQPLDVQLLDRAYIVSWNILLSLVLGGQARKTTTGDAEHADPGSKLEGGKQYSDSPYRMICANPRLNSEDMDVAGRTGPNSYVYCQPIQDQVAARQVGRLFGRHISMSELPVAVSSGPWMLRHRPSV